jgi:hypothetical protein
MSVRVLVSFFARDPVLELLLGLAQVVEQARQLCLIFPLEASSELFRPARHTQEVFNERLIRVGEDLSGGHGLVSLRRLVPKCLDSNCHLAGFRSGVPSDFTAVCA